jgi:hypothetical protein
MLPLFPVRFYQLPETKAVETKLLYNASLELSKAMQDLGLPATHKIVRGSNPSVLRKLFPHRVDTLIIGKMRNGVFSKPQYMNAPDDWLKALEAIDTQLNSYYIPSTLSMVEN